MTSSSRSPGTCHAKPSGDTRPSSASGISTVTPSSGAPGSNRYRKGSASAPCRHVSGKSSARTAPAVADSSVALSKVSRSGCARRVFFHHESKCRADTTSAGTRAS
jgi:hypothetical protein